MANESTTAEDGAPDRTEELLVRWHAGDESALHTLVEENLGWIHGCVRQRLGPKLRSRAESQDFVQETVIEVLRYSPRFVSGSRCRFRSLLARIIENTIRDRHDWFRAKRRSLSREHPLHGDSVLYLDMPNKEVTRPSEGAHKRERDALLRLALELLDPVDRQVIVLRQWEEKSFPEISAELGISADSARMKFQRALPRLGKRLAELRAEFTGEDETREDRQSAE